MFRNVITLVLCFSLITLTGYAQEVWSLERCVTYARQNSLTIKQAQNNIKLAQLVEKQSQHARYPSVNGSLSSGWQFGRTIDPTTNLFRNESSFAGRIGLDGRIIVYDGSRITNSVKQARLDVEASQLDAEAQANDISLQVAQAYLTILLNQEQLENARKRLDLSQQQLEQTDKQIRAGTLPENNRLDFLAQIARDEQTIVDAQNQVAINYLLLKQLLEVDPNLDMEIEKPTVVIPADADPQAFFLNDIYQTALATQPQVRAGEARLSSAELQENISRSGMLPTIAVFGNISTNYSTLAQDFNNPNLDNAETVLGDPKPVVIDNRDASLAEYQLRGVVFPDVAFGKQINQNFGQSVGLSISVPIYNNDANRFAIQRAQVQALNQEVANRQIRNQLKNDVQRAIANAKASKESIEAAQQSLEAARIAFENSQKRFDLGTINSLEFLTARNNLDLAEVTLTQARYQYLFDLKVVDFYLGRELRLD